MLSTVRALSQLGGGGVDVIFICSWSSPEDIIAAEELKTLSTKFTSGGSVLHVVPVISRPSPGWSGRVGRVDQHFLLQNVPDISQRLVLLCGPSSFMEAMEQVLQHMGVQDHHILKEHFNF